LEILDLLQEVRDEYELCIKRPAEYQKKVDSISDMFHLRGRNRLKGDNCPVYFVGKFEEASIIMFGLNPGYSSKNNPREELEARQSWHHYHNLYLNFFQFFARHEFQSPYYTALGHLLSGLLKKQYSNDGKWRLFDKYLANIELIPTTFSSPAIVLNAIVVSIFSCHVMGTCLTKPPLTKTISTIKVESAPMTANATSRPGLSLVSITFSVVMRVYCGVNLEMTYSMHCKQVHCN
jgi:hypothetical protein